MLMSFNVDLDFVHAKSPVRGSQFFLFDVKLVLGSEKIFPYCEVFG